ncbi:hypothetical protein MRX96_012996 [Rhipicephalus microplus]
MPRGRTVNFSHPPLGVTSGNSDASPAPERAYNATARANPFLMARAAVIRNSVPWAGHHCFLSFLQHAQASVRVLWQHPQAAGERRWLVHYERYPAKAAGNKVKPTLLLPPCFDAVAVRACVRVS